MIYRIGIDEAGRGCWAGPLVVGAVAMPLHDFGTPPVGLTDSKKLSPKKRRSLVEPIKQWALASSTGHVTPYEIDQLGVTMASRLAAHRALIRLHIDLSDVEYILLDGNQNYITGKVTNLHTTFARPFMKIPRVETLIKADLTDPLCSGASILAKVHHDHIMARLALAHPEYRWEGNQGYPTIDHAESVTAHGLTNQHRKSWGFPGSKR